MALAFQHRLAIPLWAIVFITVALTVPPTASLFLVPPATVFVIAAVGIAAIVFLMPGALPWLRASRAPARVAPSRHRHPVITLVSGTSVSTLDERNRSRADDALDLIRMDDDGGWQMPRPPA